MMYKEKEGERGVLWWLLKPTFLKEHNIQKPPMKSPHLFPFETS